MGGVRQISRQMCEGISTVIVVAATLWLAVVCCHDCRRVSIESGGQEKSRSKGSSKSLALGLLTLAFLGLTGAGGLWSSGWFYPPVEKWGRDWRVELRWSLGLTAG